MLSKKIEVAFPHVVAITVIIKNEEDYIKEWLDYHILAGVSKFYVYDNGSDDHTKEILEPYIASRIVDYLWFPGRGKQLQAYRDSLEKHRFHCKYMALIDADEFLFPVCGKTIPSIVEEIFRSSPHAGGLNVNWYIFGSSGHQKKPIGGVLENFIHRAKDDFHVHKIGKSVVNPRCVDLWNQPHYGDYFYQKYQIDETGERTNIVESIACCKIRINHYFTKSKEEYDRRRSYGGVLYGEKRPEKDFYDRDRNEMQDDSILQYIETLRHRPDESNSVINDSAESTSWNDIKSLRNKLLTWKEEIEQASQNKERDCQKFLGYLEAILTCWKLASESAQWDFFRDEMESALKQSIGKLCMLDGAVEIWEVQLLFRCIRSLSAHPGRSEADEEKTFRNGLSRFIRSHERNMKQVEPCVCAGLARSYYKLFLPSYLNEVDA